MHSLMLPHLAPALGGRLALPARAQLHRRLQRLASTPLAAASSKEPAQAERSDGASYLASRIGRFLSTHRTQTAAVVCALAALHPGQGSLDIVYEAAKDLRDCPEGVRLQVWVVALVLSKGVMLAAAANLIGAIAA